MINKKYTMATSVLNQDHKSDIYSVTQEDENLFKELDKALSLSINEKEGFITISFTDSNKNVAAQITQIAQNLTSRKNYRI